jgi:protein-S-isoprenylcysteine O-methyltransferase Ste14
MIEIILILLAFAFVHSITVTLWFKNLCRRIFGKTFMRAWYRFLYNLVSVVTAAVAFSLIARIPDRVIWNGNAWIFWYFTAVRIGALVFAAGAFQYIDGLEFLGIRQVWRYVSGRGISGNLEGLTQTELITSGVYGVVRHPMYLGAILFFTFEPRVSVNGLTVTVIADLYFIWGAFVEERRLLRIFGDQYREYMKRVPRLIPRLEWYKS